jgi:hypothetical protein
MINYIPFLKLKQNEILAIKTLKDDHIDSVVPFFDIPRPKNQNTEEIINRVMTGKAQADKYLNDIEFYLDNYDLDDTIKIGKSPQYEIILEQFKNHKVIPVAALNRDNHHNSSALKYTYLNNNHIAIRLTREDVESYKISSFELEPLIKKIQLSSVVKIDIIFDFRFINTDIKTLFHNTSIFMDELFKLSDFHRIIITGSSIPASIRDILKTKTSAVIKRKEWELWAHITTNTKLRPYLIYGDYGVVSPDYTDVELEFYMLTNVAAPKAIYTHTDEFYVVRGGAFKTHPDGYAQYYDIADFLIDHAHFRSSSDSEGEKYIYERSYKKTPRARKAGSPSSWLKATLVSHMTYLVRNL